MDTAKVKHTTCVLKISNHEFKIIPLNPVITCNLKHTRSGYGKRGTEDVVTKTMLPYIVVCYASGHAWQ